MEEENCFGSRVNRSIVLYAQQTSKGAYIKDESVGRGSVRVTTLQYERVMLVQILQAKPLQCLLRDEKANCVSIE